MTFGPLSIAPEHQRKGYGKTLLDFSMEKAKALGVGAICIEGNIDFYGKSGFVTASTKGIHYYAESRSARVPYFLVKELKEGFLNGITGTYKPPSGYFINEEEAEKFDAAVLNRKIGFSFGIFRFGKNKKSSEHIVVHSLLKKLFIITVFFT